MGSPVYGPPQYRRSLVGPVFLILIGTLFLAHRFIGLSIWILFAKSESFVTSTRCSDTASCQWISSSRPVRFRSAVVLTSAPRRRNPSATAGSMCSSR